MIALDNHFVVCGGYVLPANDCSLLPVDSLAPDQLDRIELMGNDELQRILRQHGVTLDASLRAMAAPLDAIASALSGKELTSDTFNDIADILRGCGYTIEDLFHV